MEVVQSPKGLFDYFTHAENKDKTQYDLNDIEVGCGFNLDKFLVEMNSDDFMQEVVDIIEQNDFTEFDDLVKLGYAKATAQQIIRQTKLNMVQQGYTIYNNRRLGTVPIEAVEEILGFKLLNE